MEVTLKNLKNVTTKCTAKSVSEIKTYLSEHEKCAPEQIKCIYQGKILEDSQLMSDLYQPEHHIVYMISQSKSAPQAQPKPVSKTPKSPINSEPNSPTKKHPDTPTTNTNVLSGDALQKATKEMKEMGFNEQDIQKAMRKAFNHPDRAIEYLLSGQLESQGEVEQLNPLPPPQEVQEQPEMNEISLDANEQTQMEQLLGLIQSNPEVLQQLMAANPQMGQQIMQYLQQMQNQGEPRGPFYFI
eukprot:NODE_904_length_3176_cov_0.518362.p2 type:complete len:242 gc:universal NODE_904_length_3176_cov_0.518362:2220-1495(-)